METPEWSEKTEKAKAKEAQHWAKVVRQVGPAAVVVMPRRAALPCNQLRLRWPCDIQRMFTSSAAARSCCRDLCGSFVFLIQIT